jgi:hypothetical protein
LSFEEYSGIPFNPLSTETPGRNSGKRTADEVFVTRTVRLVSKSTLGSNRSGEPSCVSVEAERVSCSRGSLISVFPARSVRPETTVSESTPAEAAGGPTKSKTRSKASTGTEEVTALTSGFVRRGTTWRP